MKSSKTRRWRTIAVASATVMATVAMLTGCSGGGGAPAPSNSVAEGEFPSYYPSDYADVIAASKKEGGTLVIYSNTDQENWAPILRDFQKKYPWVTKISADNLDSDEVFQRQLSEMATGNAPADMLVSNAVQAWATYAEKGDTVMQYKSPELQKLEKFAELMPGVYAMSLDPVGLAYNSSLIPEELKSIADLAKLVSADPGKFKGKITTRDVNGAFGFTVSKA
jgi:iron(III) transport system substrate-binding protein